MNRGTIDTDRFSEALRARLQDDQGRILISSLAGSEQAADLTEPPNCKGLGRIRHFHRNTSPGWPQNPLPIDPAVRALCLPSRDVLEAEVFQLGGCNWRCWYCYVPFDRLSADDRTGRWVFPGDLVQMYATLPHRPRVLVLSGGQPDLVPEWLPQTILELERRNLSETCYVWSDDNLSNDYFWRFLTTEEKRAVRNYRMTGRVGCFKGFDERSFAFNTQADPELYNRQFELFAKFVDFGIDMYGYVTFTSDSDDRIEHHVLRFIDRLQDIAPYLPLRVIPLEIREFTPLSSRVTREEFVLADRVQREAVTVWNQEMLRRFTEAERAIEICDVQL